MKAQRRSGLALLGLAMLCTACVETIGDAGPGRKVDGAAGDEKPPPTPFEPVSLEVAAAKVKDLLTGLPLTDDERRAVTADAHALRGLIDLWMQAPEFRAKTLVFFQKAFQQSQLLVPNSLEEQLHLNFAGSGIDYNLQARLLRSVQESFARTALAIVEEGRPFTETVTTTRFALNVPLMAALAYNDAVPLNDNDRNADMSGFWLLKQFPGFTTVSTNNLDPTTGKSTPIPFSETIDPASPNFMRWYVERAYDPDEPCEELHRDDAAVYAAYRKLFGEHGGYGGCVGAPAEGSIFTDADFDSWRMVTIRKPEPGEMPTFFWDVPKFRDPNTTTLVVKTPRVGFMTTLAFFANWPTNVDNSYRVITNQTLIVALGRSFDASAANVETTPRPPGDEAHAQPGTSCYGCHRFLDPMRDFFEQSYSTEYYRQVRTTGDSFAPIPAQARFSFLGSTPVAGSGIEVLASAIAAHPRFAISWAKKMCLLANNRECAEDDPETKRVADAFEGSHFDFKVLVREMFSSPLITFATPTEAGERNGAFTGIARREHFCARLENRLGIRDVCNERGESALAPDDAAAAHNLALGIPGTTYGRGDDQPVAPADPNPFFASATEKVCSLVAQSLVEAGPNGRWLVSKKESALVDFVTQVMGVPPSDPRASSLKEILQRHYDAALTTESDVDALRSTFVAACQSPLAVSSGL